MAHESEVGAVPLAVGRRLLGGSQVVGRGGFGQHGVLHPGQDGELVAAGAAAAPRHHGGSIPTEDGAGFAERCDAGEAVVQTGVGGHERSVLRAKTAKMTTSEAERPNQVIA